MTNKSLYLGDCIAALKALPDKSVDLVLTDPPYGLKISSNPFRQKFPRKDWDDFIPTKEYFDEMRRVSKNQIIWGGNYFSEYLPASRGFLIWDKVQPEKFSSAMCELAWMSRQSPAKIFKMRVVGFEKFHPTTKPLPLMEWCLGLFPDAKIVMDPFMGSGTTGVACMTQGRDFIGCEKDSEYFGIAKDRIEKEDSQ